VLHNSGSVIATCSGQRSLTPIIEDTSSDSEESDEEEIEEDGIDEDGSDTDESSDDLPTRSVKATGRTPDNSIKIWSL
jgi:hypothetical protein